MQAINSEKDNHECIIETKKLEKLFQVGSNEIGALRGVDLKVNATDFLVVYGPSGCGKSTLLNILSGVDTPTKGEVTVRGRRMERLDEDERARFRADKMGIVHQHPSWIKSLNVFENVALPLIINGIDQTAAYERAKAVLKDLNIEDLGVQQPLELSGGQQQKAAIGRALITSPWIIMADEPTGNLDTASSDEIMNVFHTLNVTYKRTIIMVTHNQAYWSLGNSRLEMKDGQVVKHSQNG